MQKVMFLVIVSTTILACKKNESFQKEDEIQSHILRVKNNTPFSFDKVFIERGESQHNYGLLLPDEISDYKSFTYVDFLGYPYIRVSIERQEFEFDI